MRMEMESKFQQREPQKAETDRPNLTGIPTQMKLNFEQRSGMSFDDVRVHYNSDKPAQFHALAYTQGTQIYVGPGQERSLPHELGHVVQQKAGRVRPTRWVRGQPVNDQPELEREADRTPIQCMPAPASRGVIQMEWPILPRQRGNNCGYHALARAMNNLCDLEELKKLFVKDNFLEIQLTSYAIETGFSVIGEAFDPYALAHVGNMFCEKNDINVKCEVCSFQEVRDLSSILKKAASDKSIILVPYFADVEKNMDVITNPKRAKENAHWGVIDPQNPSIYEGNLYGSIYEVDKDKPKWMRPLKLDLTTLLASNESIKPSFSWLNFLTERIVSVDHPAYDQVRDCIKEIASVEQPPSTDLSKMVAEALDDILMQINSSKANVVDASIPKGKNAMEQIQSFSKVKDLFDKAKAVKDKIKSISAVSPGQSDPFVQDVTLSHHVVKVTKGS